MSRRFADGGFSLRHDDQEQRLFIRLGTAIYYVLGFEAADLDVFGGVPPSARAWPMRG